MASFAIFDDEQILSISRTLMLRDRNRKEAFPKITPPKTNRTSMGAIRHLNREEIGEIREVWLAKHVLTHKVQHLRGSAREDGWFTPSDGSPSVRLGKDCFLTREEAHEHANMRRLKKIEALYRQIERIEALV